MCVGGEGVHATFSGVSKRIVIELRGENQQISLDDYPQW